GQAEKYRTVGAGGVGAGAASAGARRAGGVGLVRELGVGRLVGIEISIDRIVRDHAGEHSGARYQIARRDDGARYAAVDRRAYVREVEIQSRSAELCADRGHVGLSLGLR